MDDLQGLKSHLPSHLVLVTPRAPFPAAPWGYGPGWAWYQYAGEDGVVRETLEESQACLHDFLKGLPERLPHAPGPLVMGGFSQGGTMALRWALEHPGSAAGVVMLSGFVVAEPPLSGSLEASRELPILWSHGMRDPAIPFGLGERGRRALKEAGLVVTEVDHPGGHWIPPEALELLPDWLSSLPAEGPPWP